MKAILFIAAAAVLLMACSGKSEIPTRKKSDGLAYHPSPVATGDGIPVAPVKSAAVI